ncbi:hypothetical protein SMA5143A_8275 [Streptomyces sp. MA5143a]|nr:hypothetical protein SMA5143A_8275 [Streptomyces sp. MA5143a]
MLRYSSPPATPRLPVLAGERSPRPVHRVLAEEADGTE